jgi:hypothetical protein
LYNQNDESFLNIALPGVLDMDNEDDLAFYKIMDKMNSTMKCLKACVVDDGMWLFCERELVGDEDLRKCVARMICCLETGANYLFSLVDDSKNDTGGETEDEEITEISEN